MALVFRTIPLFVILWQFRLLAGELAGPGVFAAALLAAFAAAFIFSFRGIKPGPALLAIVLLPWITRFFIALPRVFAGKNLAAAIAWDSLLFNLDRNAFVFLLPFYWAGFSSYFSARSRRFFRADIAVAQILLLLIFVMRRSADLAVYRWPALPIALFSCIVFMQIIALMLSLPPELRVRKSEKITAAAVLLLLTIAGGLLMIRPSQESAVDRGGGLLQPNLFQFDFSQILKLESEIKMNDDLALIVRTDNQNHIYTRRFVLSGYNVKQGFYRLEDSDEIIHPSRIPARRTSLNMQADGGEEKTTLTEIVEQEYYLVNFDSTAFIGMNQPLIITPFETWDASSFSSAYAVQSRVSDAGPFELIDQSPSASLPAGGPRFTHRDLNMSAEEFSRYTEYSSPRRVVETAQDLTADLDSYWQMVEMIYEWLSYGDFRYSLKPGIAADGDQLSHFLFVSKKGYCSYFAFSFALMLRSLGIPCRVAVGFFIDRELGAFDYYAVRSDMAHAWVEVYYPGFGWVDYDPTTSQIAEGENFDLTRSVEQDLFERLMKEILENRARLKEKEGDEENARNSLFADLPARAARFFRSMGIPLIIIIIVFAFMLYRTGILLLFYLRKEARKKILSLWKHSLRRLALGGIKKRKDEGEAEWAAKLGAFELYALYQDSRLARYAEHCGNAELSAAQEHYRVFNGNYRLNVSKTRRALAWFCPPLALLWRKKTPLL
jgi:hypothetical protein